MNKIKNFANSVKDKFNRKSVEICCKAKSTLTNECGEFYIDKTVGIIIAVVVGALLLGIVYAFIKTNVGTTLTTEINKLWNYKPTT